MKFRKHILNEGGSEINDMLNFIVKNKQHLNYTHLLEPVWDSVAQKKFEAETGFYPDIRYGNFAIGKLGWEFKGGRNKNYDGALADFKKFQEGSATSPKEMKEKTSFTDLLEFAKWKTGNKIIGIAGHNLGSFFRFLRYVMFGRLDTNLAQGNAIEDTLRVKSGMMNAVPGSFPFTKIPDLKNIQLKKFMNGALQIKGMSSRDVEEAQRIFKLTCRYNR